jgi:protein tyrosine phosphatase (PTP) superfamily phosphohydrolase (DUF442 family)
VILLLALPAGACTATGPLRPFTTDGCSVFPDGLPNHRDLWLQCCTDHDRAYWLGGTASDRRAADRQLRHCVAAAGKPAAADLMLRGVRVGGSPWLPTSFRWGYGWPYGRGYQEVTADEEFEALQLLRSPETAGTFRPARWAQPLAVPGVPNLHRVSDKLYRSAQPDREGMENLKTLGINTVVNLRAFHSDRERLEATGLGYEHIVMAAWNPEYDDAVRFLRVVTDPARAPALVHCQHGADRTGVMIALYRVVVQGWNRHDAIREMVDGGYGFHAVWFNLAPWLDSLDIEALRRDAGIEPPAAADVK